MYQIGTLIGVLVFSGIARILVRGGTLLGVGLVGGPGGRAPGPREFSKDFEKILKKIANNFSIIFKEFNKPCVKFCAFGRKTQIVGKI